MGEMFALKAIELVAKYLPAAYKDGSSKEARENMALANSLAAYYMPVSYTHLPCLSGTGKEFLRENC